MPVSVECRSCHAALTLSEESTARKILCPHCGDKLEVPIPPGPTARIAEASPEPEDEDGEESRSGSPSLLVSSALLCGSMALLVASVSVLSFLAKPLAALGLLLSVVAWLRSRDGQESIGIVLPSSAVVCLLVLLFAGSWQDLKQAVSRPGRAARSRTVMVPTGKQGMEPWTRVEPDGWVDVTQGAVQQNGVRVRVTSAALGFARLRVGGKEQRAPAKRLLVGVRMTGEHLVSLVNYESWGDPNRETGRHEPRLTDDRERKYSRVSFGAAAQLAGSAGDTFLTPGKPIVDQLVFEAPPLEEIQFLRLELPASAFGGAGTLRFQIPKSAIKVN